MEQPTILLTIEEYEQFKKWIDFKEKEKLRHTRYYENNKEKLSNYHKKRYIKKKEGIIEPLTCIFCNYTTHLQNSYNKHLESGKHMINEKLYKLQNKME